MTATREKSVSRNGHGAHTLTDRREALMDELRRIKIGERLKELREDAAMTQPQVAERADVSFRAYQDWEYGKSGTDIEQYEKLARVFGVPVTEILVSENGEPIWVEGLRDQLAEVLDRLDLLEAELAATLIDQQSESATPPPEADAAEAAGR